MSQWPSTEARRVFGPGADWLAACSNGWVASDYEAAWLAGLTLFVSRREELGSAILSKIGKRTGCGLKIYKTASVTAAAHNSLPVPHQQILAPASY